MEERNDFSDIQNLVGGWLFLWHEGISFVINPKASHINGPSMGVFFNPK